MAVQLYEQARSPVQPLSGTFITHQRRRFRTVAATPRFTARIPTYVYWRAQHTFTLLVILEKIVFHTVLIFIGDDRAEAYVLDALKNIALNIRVDLLKVGDQLFGLHAF